MSLRIIFIATCLMSFAAPAAKAPVPYSEQEIREKLDELYIGKSSSVQTLKNQLVRVIPVNITVLIIGETGTGKEVVASAIHKLGPRRNEAFVALNTGAIAPSLVESELFGHKKGAFTGATADRSGAFQMSDKGVLFLDELGTMPKDLQVKLLRALEMQEVSPVGSHETLAVDTRIIAATNEDLPEAVRKGTFREDLYFRLNVVTLKLPPLRDRPEDIPLLIAHFSKRKKAALHFSKAALETLQAYPWPGNVRELLNLLEQMTLLGPQDKIEVADLPERIQNPQPFLESLGWTRNQPVINARGETQESALHRIGCEAIISAHRTLKDPKKTAKRFDVPESLILDVLSDPPKPKSKP